MDFIVLSYFIIMIYLGISYFEIIAIVYNKKSIIFEGIVVGKEKSIKEFTIEKII